MLLFYTIYTPDNDIVVLGQSFEIKALTMISIKYNFLKPPSFITKMRTPLLDFHIKPQSDRSHFQELLTGIKETSAVLSVSVLEVGGLP